MAPIPEAKLKGWITRANESATTLIWTKSTCPFCIKLKQSLDDAQIKYGFVEIDKREDTARIQDLLNSTTGIRTVPQLFIHGQFIGGSEKALQLLASGELKKKIEGGNYDYDFVVIGGGSGGLSASKEAAAFGARTAVLDFVAPTPMGTTWGLGGTCVNVGCIPKKLMHQAANHRHNIEDAAHYGWKLDSTQVHHDWQTMVENVQNYIKSLNWGYRTSLTSSKVKYINALGRLIDPHTIECTDKDGTKTNITSKYIVLATGERPRYPDVPGDRDTCITSDDLFSLPYNPGKTLVVGASYVALECAGFLAAMGNDVTVMVRSIFLRGFDQEMANKIGEYMQNHGVKFVKECVPTKFTSVQRIPEDRSRPGKVNVEAQFVNSKQPFKETYDTVLLAIGRDPCTRGLNLESNGIKLDKAGRVICDEEEHSSVPSVYALGDIVSERLQLTPVAIEAGRNLAHRLFSGSETLTNYHNVATTVFTPLEYGSIGLPEEQAISIYGAEDIEIYHSYYKPLEWTVAEREDNVCYAKLVCVKSHNDKVVGLHILGPNAGEMTQGFALGMRLNATKEDFDRTIGIHPTCAEIFTTLRVTKSSGMAAEKTGC
ncbi:Thioredoxin reductase 2, mitochondrial [Cichlidogyrus casuarinus]|uniref:thioredoxin-disulfide reductase (NADPH) n=1 Tax=Cichlidogyrus casuarinus TaxID=1844966 RepID=A0ABD2QP04_9PLAT